VAAEAFSLEDFEERARAIVRAAEARAAEMQSRARRDAEGVRESARAEGYAFGLTEGGEAGRASGLAAGRAEALEELRREGHAALAAIDELARDLAARKAELVRTGEEGLLQFAVEVASRVVAREVGRLPAGVESLVRKGVELVGTSGDVAVELNPADVELLTELGLSAESLSGPAARVRFVAEPAISRGGCRVRGEAAEADLRIEKALERIRSALMGEGGS